MKKLKINGNKKLIGEVRISGSKNAALPIIAAALLTPDDVILHNVPDLSDVRTMLKLLEGMGVKVVKDGATICINASQITNTKAPYELVKTMRASILTLCPLVARFGHAEVSLPGGCAIGARPVDQHIKGLQQFGASVTVEKGYVNANAIKLFGTTISTDMITVTGTENLMMAATLADGITVINNAAREPEIEDLAKFLKSLGADIQGEGTSSIRIKGVKALHGTEYTVQPDRIEAGTFLVSGVLTQGNVTIRKCNPNHLKSVLEKLSEAGAQLKIGDDWINISIQNRPTPVSISTAPYPDFPTDMQAQFMILNCISDGTSYITENIFENRFMHIPELRRLGANIQIENNTAIITGVPQLIGAPVMSTDLRASAALVLGGLAAEGETIIDRIYHLDRGYENIEIKLRSLGADVLRI